MDDRKLFTALLGIEAPWYVEKVELQLTDGEVVVHLEHEASARLLCRWSQFHRHDAKMRCNGVNKRHFI